MRKAEQPANWDACSPSERDAWRELYAALDSRDELLPRNKLLFAAIDQILDAQDAVHLCERVIVRERLKRLLPLVADLIDAAFDGWAFEKEGRHEEERCESKSA